jgi:hypothetical protein
MPSRFSPDRTRRGRRPGRLGGPDGDQGALEAPLRGCSGVQKANKAVRSSTKVAGALRCFWAWGTRWAGGLQGADQRKHGQPFVRGLRRGVQRMENPSLVDRLGSWTSPPAPCGARGGGGPRRGDADRDGVRRHHQAPSRGSGLPAGGGVDGVLVNGQLCWARLYRDSDPGRGVAGCLAGGAERHPNRSGPLTSSQWERIRPARWCWPSLAGSPACTVSENDRVLRAAASKLLPELEPWLKGGSPAHRRPRDAHRPQWAGTFPRTTAPTHWAVVGLAAGRPPVRRRRRRAGWWPRRRAVRPASCRPAARPTSRRGRSWPGGR